MWGISMAGEGKERMVVKDLVENKVQGEEVPFSFPVGRKGQELRAAAMVYLENLEDHVLHLLEENNLLVTNFTLL